MSDVREKVDITQLINSLDFFFFALFSEVGKYFADPKEYSFTAFKYIANTYYMVEDDSRKADLAEVGSDHSRTFL